VRSLPVEVSPPNRDLTSHAYTRQCPSDAEEQAAIGFSTPQRIIAAVVAASAPSAPPASPPKPLGGYGDGGACFTADQELAERTRRISRHGQSRRYFHSDVGVNGRIDTLQAAIVLAKLELFEAEVAARGRIGAELSARLREAGINSTPRLAPGNTSVYAQFTIEVENRAAVQAALKEQGIPTAVHYPTLLCQQPALAGQTPCAERCR